MRSAPWRFALATGLALTACRDGTAPLPSDATDLVPAASSATSQTVADHYIVVFTEGVTDPLGAAAALTGPLGGEVRFVYTSALRGFAARLPAATLPALQSDPRVAYIQPDHATRRPEIQHMDANGDPWGLDRIDQRSLPLSGTYSYRATGGGVHAYIIDTGISTSHPDFGGRADNVYDALGLDGDDCHGHGTHVAGIVGGTTWGVAKGVRLHGVRVLNCAGVGLESDLIAGVDWVHHNHVKPAVANMSLSGPFSAALNSAVTSLSNAGVFVAAAAGNDNVDACTASPASADGVLTVAASTKVDAKAAFSNWGHCVELYAPGDMIKSAFLLGMTRIASGTSAAAPHVAGVAVLYKATFGDASSATVGRWILRRAVPHVITGNPDGTPNRLLFKDAL
jgi:subtilisin family serine protease